MQIGLSKVTSKGQITIPTSIRENKKIETGAELVFIDLEEGVLLKKATDLFGVFDQCAKEIKLTRKGLLKEIEEERQRTLEKHYRHLLK